MRNNGLKAQLNLTRGNASGVWRGNTRANDVATSKYGVVTHYPYKMLIISISAPTVVENPVGGLLNDIDRTILSCDILLNGTTR